MSRPQNAAPPRRKAAAPRDAAAFAVQGALWLQQGGQALGGSGRVKLLEAVRDTGSMTRAAKALGISYKTAWDHVQDMNNLASSPLVQRSAGGAGGGGTTLTDHGLALIDAFRRLEREHERLLERLSKQIAEPRRMLHELSRLALRTSARNQLLGTVTRVQAGAVNASVELALSGSGECIHVSLTMGSLQRLGIEAGTQAVALIKAPSVMLAAAGAMPRLSVANCLSARVQSVQRGAVNAELQLQLAGGQTMVAVTTLAGLERLGLEAGAAANVLFAETSVILGVV